MLTHLNKRAQSTAEYVIVLALVVGAVIAMQTYVKRGLQGRIKDVVDKAPTGGDAGTIFKTGQFEPDYMQSSFTSSRNTNETENLLSGGGVTRNLTSDISTRTGYQEIKAVNGEGGAGPGGRGGVGDLPPNEPR